MINTEFFTADGLLNGFKISGHSESAEHGQDIICAFVSSAAYMTANTITDVCGVKAYADAYDGFMELKVLESAANVQDILNGLKLHLTELSAQYPDNINVIITEV